MELLVEHARAENPRECCGVLVGRRDGVQVVVEEVRRGRNRAASQDLYELDPEDFVAADLDAETRGLEVVGFYHSHPRGPDRLSQVDREQAWPGYVYLLVSLETRSRSGVSVWVQAVEGAGFEPLVLDLRK